MTSHKDHTADFLKVVMHNPKYLSEEGLRAAEEHLRRSAHNTPVGPQKLKLKYAANKARLASQGHKFPTEERMGVFDLMSSMGRITENKPHYSNRKQENRFWRSVK